MTTAAPDATTPPAPTAAPPTTPTSWVQLENLERQPMVLVLDVHTEAASFLRRQMVTVLDHNPKTGEQSPRQERRRVPTSITLWPKGAEGSKSGPLHCEVLRAGDVQRALAAKRLRVIRNVADPTPPPHVEEAAETTQQAPPGNEAATGAPSADGADQVPPVLALPEATQVSEQPTESSAEPAPAGGRRSRRES